MCVCARVRVGAWCVCVCVREIWPRITCRSYMILDVTENRVILHVEKRDGLGFALAKVV